ncbi:hypothetical protein PN836_011150 [Ningiella sp. W23]|uniref:hypothetical protein n=1 Tax=Ningiella sp. W23 TaxID=3023715 RepID=UPI003757C652
MGIALVSASSVIFFKQSYDFYAVTGILLIVSGTLVISFKSSAVLQCYGNMNRGLQ